MTIRSLRPWDHLSGLASGGTGCTPRALLAHVLFALVCLGWPVGALAQSDTTLIASPGPGTVLGLGGGIGSEGPAALISLGFPVWRGELLVRAGGTAEIAMAAGGATGDVGLLFGLRAVGRRHWGRIAAGPGVVAQEREVPCVTPSFWSSCSETDTGVGVLGQAELVWALHPRFGLGLSLFGGAGSGGAAYVAASLGVFFGRGG